MDSNLRREIIVDNYQNPTNRKIIENNEHKIGEHMKKVVFIILML